MSRAFGGGSDAQRASIERELPQGGEAGILTIGP